MTYVPKPLHHESYKYGQRPMSGGTVPAITVHALKENKRPIGFAPWPDPERKSRAKAKPKKRTGKNP